MLRISICALILSSCATPSKSVTRDVRNCVYIGSIASGPRDDVLSETETMGPSHIIWLHPPEVVRGYFVQSNRSLYRCPTPPPPAGSSRQG
jgi:hypothetical protein